MDRSLNQTGGSQIAGTMEDRLERVLNQVIDWLKYEEAKNGAVITLDGVAVGVIGQLPPLCLSPWLRVSMLINLISLMIALVSFWPVRKADWINRLARVLKLWRTDTTPKAGICLYFGDIAGYDAKTYLSKFRAAAGLSGGDTAPESALESDYAEEIVANAKITMVKLRLFEVALAISFLAVVVPLVGAFVHLLR